MTVDSLSIGTARADRLWLPLAAATIFLAAFLLFQVELLIAKLILPWFGGSAAVWLACLLFFQLALLAGYLYAHLLASRVPPKMQALLHSGLLLVSLALLPIIPSQSWKPTGGEDPLLLIIELLSGTIGLPFLLLASSTPLLQAWIARGAITDIEGIPRASIYRLYALSNLGSMLALLSYPLLVEPALPTRLQAWSWSFSYLIFAGLGIALAWRQRGAPAAAKRMHLDADTPRITIATRIFWIALPAASSALLLAVSNYILRNVAAMPLLWVVPLALYLLSFIVAFDRPRWYHRTFWLVMGLLWAFIVSRLYIGALPISNVGWLLASFAVALFVFCMVCHGELARLKPASDSLTAYYLSIAFGGAVGGLSIAVLAPALLPADFDLPLILSLSALLVIAAAWRSRPAATDKRSRVEQWVMLAGAVLVTVEFAKTMAGWEYSELSKQVYIERNFYGPLGVNDEGTMRSLWNGNIVHGREYMTPESAGIPISYYSKISGVGIALTERGTRGTMHVGVIGLGAGTIGAYARAGDAFRFYEINPAVPDIAKRLFRYLDICGKSCEITLGDARLSLESEQPNAFDVLVVDAFSSDAIPVHLLTREAFAQYWRHLKPDGVLAIHTSNRFVNLPPLIGLAAKEAGRTARLVASSDIGVDTAEWVLVAPDATFFAQPSFKEAKDIALPEGLVAWTDDYSNLWRSLR